jgi:hypothetical protein
VWAGTLEEADASYYQTAISLLAVAAKDLTQINVDTT